MSSFIQQNTRNVPVLAKNLTTVLDSFHTSCHNLARLICRQNDLKYRIEVFNEVIRHIKVRIKTPNYIVMTDVDLGGQARDRPVTCWTCHAFGLGCWKGSRAASIAAAARTLASGGASIRTILEKKRVATTCFVV